MKDLVKIQTELKVPKGNFNSFGKYKYRSCEDILEAVKPILNKYNATFSLTDEVVLIGTKLFVKSTASIHIGEDHQWTCGFAELAEHKGMSAEQATGTASSYARKYALNGLFLIDETESDPDSKDNTKTEVKKPAIDNARFEKAIESIRNSEFSVEQLQAKFELTELQSKALLLINQ
jgi:hypothetical protein